MRPCAGLDIYIYIEDHVSLIRKNALLWDTMLQLSDAVRGTTCLLHPNTATDGREGTQNSGSGG